MTAELFPALKPIRLFSCGGVGGTELFIAQVRGFAKFVRRPDCQEKNIFIFPRRN